MTLTAEPEMNAALPTIDELLADALTALGRKNIEWGRGWQNGDGSPTALPWLQLLVLRDLAEQLQRLDPPAPRAKLYIWPDGRMVFSAPNISHEMQQRIGAQLEAARLDWLRGDRAIVVPETDVVLVPG